MKPIVLPRLPGVSLFIAAVLLALHFGLCVPAATSRGFPSIHPFWETIARYIAFLGFILFPFFEDGLKIRRFIRNSFVPLACLMNGIVGTNLMSARPHTGHLVGITGILNEDTGSVVFFGIIHMAVWFPISYGLDVIGARLWPICRGFSDPNRREGSFRFSTTALLGLVVVSAGVFGAVTWSMRLYENWPGGHWSDECRRNLKEIASAMYQYELTFGTLPPAYIEDASGKPIHSWRVLLLPFLDQKELYDAYCFDEPWDGPNNRHLVRKMPSVYGCRWDDGRKAGQTSYVVITGDGTAFPGSKGVKSTSIRDGTSLTILCVEFSRSGIEWTEPRDLAFDRMNLAVNPQTGGGMRTIHHGRNDLGCMVVLCGGSSRYLSKETSPDLVKALITINGGERILDSEF